MNTKFANQTNEKKIASEKTIHKRILEFKMKHTISFVETLVTWN